MRLSRRQLLAAAGLTALAGGISSNESAAAAALARTWSGEIQVSDWEQYYLGLDGGAHQKALKALGIAHRDGVRADEQYLMVPVESVRRAALEFGDHAAADVLRARFGLDSPSMLGRGLKLVLGQDRLEKRYFDEPGLQLRYIGYRRRFANYVLPMPSAVRKALA
ncbi:hypothetical protein SAMN04488074_105281 [Lentzea albidocapillata subsp. violacea]|uniref:TAT (Twin-arginine translocation) pathway signal sequence n=1 Tax=Lentzea albidocapillata subsp. violacea TaxID=128104 RepID=A0A1G9BBG3_9PSEU|nr:hypothetical protein [Lentzea albidocapillata]SDK36821.1 hypothetical protein SAMN04488074_105281 [Lentzea albidocapillata subsp. violacea]